MWLVARAGGARGEPALTPPAPTPRRALRQIAHRARKHVEARRPREAVSASRTREVLEQFQRAIETRDLSGLLELLAPEVVLVGDGGGVKQAVLRPILGARKVATLFLGGLRKVPGALTLGLTHVNGSPALVVYLDGELDGVMAVDHDGAHITGMYYVRNPHKLTHLGAETPLTVSRG
ncbi:hypothetical protein [Nocardia farcinica]|uniref:hypothetical protein n=1 Tax=Nocardia farcinica TaxID=37329 RepID=UPI0024553548|nr:hypothetical protein [Nocardia farcinica]